MAFNKYPLDNIERSTLRARAWVRHFDDRIIKALKLTGHQEVAEEFTRFTSRIMRNLIQIDKTTKYIREELAKGNTNL